MMDQKFLLGLMPGEAEEYYMKLISLKPFYFWQGGQ